MTEVMLEESLSAACFLNDLRDLLVGFKNHIFYIDHAKCKWFINLILQVPNDRGDVGGVTECCLFP